MFLWAALVLSLGIAAGSGLAIASIRHFERTLVKIDVGRGCRGAGCLRDIEPGPCIREACNFLIIGSDSRRGFRRNTQVEGQRADTIIVVQTDVRNDRTVVLSIPRDLRVRIPGDGWNKINTAFERGANTIVRAVEQLTGLQINHYVQVNFVGFERLVNALGGVPVCVNRPMVDSLSGLNLPRAGCYNLKGRQALAFVRARHIEGDIIPDFSRIARQQQFIRAVIDKALSAGAALRYLEIAEAISDNLKMDRGLDLYSLQDLTLQLARLGQQGVDFRVVPTRPVDIEGVSYLELIRPDAPRLFRRIRDGLALGRVGKEQQFVGLSPANVFVRVMDADSGGAAGEVAEYLRRAGFVVTATEPAPPQLRRTALLWGHGATEELKTVAAYLSTIDRIRRDDRHTVGREITVVIGPDFPGIEGI